MAAVMSSSGMPWLIVSVFVAFRKAVVVLLAACMLLSRLAELRSLCSHSPVVDVPDQCNGFGASAHLFHAISISQHEACVICMFVM